MKLVALEGHAPGAEYALGARAFTVGRAASSNLTLEDDDVSREHCRIRPTEDGYVIEDLNSRNGTILNGQRISRPTPLHPGDLVIVGRALFEVRAAAVSASPRKAPPGEPMSRGGSQPRSAAPNAPRPGSRVAAPAPPLPSPSPAAPNSEHPVRVRTPARAGSIGILADTAEDAALTGRQVRRRAAALARHEIRVGVLSIIQGSAREGGELEAKRLLAVCAMAAADRGVRNLAETLGAEAHALHRVVSLALALHEAIGG